MNSLCLVMIVKNEEKNICRLLDTLYPLIDTFSICDTGSTDNTMSTIQKYFQKKNINGNLYSHPFQNFEYNRNWILQKSIGMSDFLLLLDADMSFCVTGFDKTKLDKNCYYQLYQGTECFSYLNTRIVPSHPEINYVGVTHEYLSVPCFFKKKVIPKTKCFIYDYGDGGCKTDKFQRDIQLLEKSFSENPKNTRTIFYLANSYYDVKNYSEAIKYYQKRIELRGWKEEIWYSHYRLGHIYKILKQYMKAVHYWLECIHFNPHRIENIYEIIKLYRVQEKYQIAYSFYKMALNMIPTDLSVYHQCLFFHNSVYDYELDYEFSIIAYYNQEDNIQKPFLNIIRFTDKFTKNMLCNYKYYNNKLTNIFCVDFSETIEIENLGTFHSSSGCLVEEDKNGYMFLVRYVNYKISPNGTYSDNKNIISIYKLYSLNSFFEIIDFKMINIPKKNDFKYFYVGDEDIRLFPWKDHIHFIGTTFINDSTKTKICVGVGETKEIQQKQDIVLQPIYRSSFPLEQCEKNWVYCPFQNKLHIIYKWFPLQICYLNGRTLKLIKEIEMPNLFKIIRGSSCGFVKENEIWFVTHVVSHETPRNYYHVFVVFDLEMNLLRYTSLLKFSDKPIEYVLSIVVTDNTVIIPYSIMDGQTKIATFDRDYIERFFTTKTKID